MQQILSGIDSLAPSLKPYGKVLLVCDGSYPFLNIRDDIEKAADAASCLYVRFDGFSSNPLYESVCDGVKLFNDNGCEAIVAVGGGSSIDVAKCIKLYCRMAPDKLFLEQPYKDSGIPLIAIPTTAGTGSESTRYAVIYYQGKKQSVTHDSIIPNIAILEPKVLETLPLYQKKCTMLDALCQGIESWWSVNATDESRVLSRLAVEGIMANWEAYIFNYTPQSAAAIMRAANLAGQAICITQTTAPHAFSYKLTSIFGLPHGHAVALGLPEIWDFMLLSFRQGEASGEISLLSTFTAIANAMGVNTPKEAIALFRDMMSRMGLTVGQIASGPCQDRESILDTLAASVNPIRLANNPVQISTADAREIYSRILQK